MKNCLGNLAVWEVAEHAVLWKGSHPRRWPARVMENQKKEGSELQGEQEQEGGWGEERTVGESIVDKKSQTL